MSVVAAGNDVAVPRCYIRSQTSADEEKQHHQTHTNGDSEWVRDQQGPHTLTRSQLSHALIRGRSHGSAEDLRGGDDERMLTKPRAFTVASTPVSQFDDIIGEAQAARKCHESPDSFDTNTLSDGRHLVGTSASAVSVCRTESAVVKRTPDRHPISATIRVLSAHVHFSSSDGRSDEENSVHTRDGNLTPAARARKRSLLVGHASSTRIDSDPHDEANYNGAQITSAPGPLSRDASSNYSLEEENEDTWM